MIETLTARELEITELIVDGLSNTEISKKLHVTENTVKAHITRVFSKLNVDSRTQLAVLFTKKTHASYHIKDDILKRMESIDLGIKKLTDELIRLQKLIEYV